MDINLIALNVGNTRLGIGVFVGGKLELVSRTPLADRAVWRERLAEAWRRVADKPRPSIAGASVNPAGLEDVEHIVQELTQQPVQWVGKDLELPIGVLTETPEETGVDRVLNIAAAYEQMGKACVVVDAGTAITVDCCDDNGNFLGGAITPGVQLMLQALHERTAKLPLVEFAPPAEPLGRTTAEAIRNGIYTGVRGMVKELVENYATFLGHWPELIATGGDAQTLFSGWELVHAVSPDLTLYGIALAYTEHHIRHDEEAPR